MRFLLGILIAAISIVGSIFYLHQSLGTYVDDVAVFCVFGGTLAVAVVTLPWENRLHIWLGIRGLIVEPKKQWKLLGEEAISLVGSVLAGSPRTDYASTGLAGEIFRDGAELIGLGFSAEKIEAILMERLRHGTERTIHVANSLRALAKYPPAFGLVGTVLTLVSLMRAIASGVSSQEAGSRMAVALVATLYGLVVANLLINPVGERILALAKAEEKEAELATQAVMLAAERTSLLESQEMLNSHLERRDRINVLAGAGFSNFEEAA
jgi:chemotaxis protein MotA